jgi:hypothetical protein
MPTFVPSIFSSTISDSSAMNAIRLGFAQVLVVVGPLGAKQMGRPGVLDEIAM